MKKLSLLLLWAFFFLWIVTPTYALSVEDNGYIWNSADVEIRLGLCKVISSRTGKDYVFWLAALNEAYNTTNPVILKQNIQFVVAFIAAMDTD